MTFGGPLLKSKPRRPKTIITAFPAETLKEIIAHHLIAVSVIDEYDDVSIKLPEMFEKTIPLEIKVFRNGLKRR